MYTCPYCKHDKTTPTIGAFMEIGEYDGKHYQGEGNADGYTCDGCGKTFWVNGPEVDSGD